MEPQCQSTCKRCVVAEPADYKIFNDPIHGTIALHPLCVKIMDTVEFQRLRQLKQLGCCYFVFPGASHNRFEHCIGVSHLAGEFARKLQRSQPELNIDCQDVLCLEIAGLLHDIGHGPFSHVFDGMVIPQIISGSTWKHEDASKMMYQRLIDKEELKKEFNKHSLDANDITFIKHLISPPAEKNHEIRPKEKDFLYEIVANTRNNIDVDKWDYFARDALMLGVDKRFNHDRFMKFARVIEYNGEYQICMRDKEAVNVYEMFHTRDMLHRRAYQHRVTKCIEIMIADAFQLANGVIDVPGTPNKKLKLSDAIQDMEIYTKMTDNILYDILNSPSNDRKLVKSRVIVSNVLKRKLYPFVGEASPRDDKRIITREEVQEMKRDLLEQHNRTYEEQELREEDLEMQLVTLHYGNKEKNPIDNVRFYSKHKPNEAFRMSRTQVSVMLPHKFMEQKIRLYRRPKVDETKLDWLDGTQHTDKVDAIFYKWCTDNNYEPDSAMEDRNRTRNQIRCEAPEEEKVAQD